MIRLLFLKKVHLSSSLQFPFDFLVWQIAVLQIKTGLESTHFPPSITQPENTPRTPVTGRDLRDHLIQWLHFRDGETSLERGKWPTQIRVVKLAQLRWKGGGWVSVIFFPSSLPQPGPAHAKATPSAYIAGCGEEHAPRRKWFFSWWGRMFLVLNRPEAVAGSHAVVKA